MIIRLSIREKIISIILAVTLISLLGAFAIEVYSKILSSRQDLIRNITLDAKLISDYSVPTLLFDDKKEAEIILQKLSNFPSVIHGAIYDDVGTIFAEYNKTGIIDTSGFNVPKTIFKNHRIFVAEKISSKGENLGIVFLVASTEIIRVQTIDHIRTILLIFLLTVIIAVVLSLILERIISVPIRDLAKVTEKIENSGDFSVRVIKKSSDETGHLYDTFNRLLESLQAREKERDIAEYELLAERANLEKRVLERTNELNEAKLKAEESDKLKSAFLANMSHEIRTPLNAILGFSNLFNDPSTTSADRLEYTRMMEVSASDLIKLIDDILVISRIEANQIEITLEDCQVNSLLKEIFEAFKQAMKIDNPESKINPVLNIPDANRNYILKTDRLRLKQILLNILNNAIKFTPSGSIEMGYFTEEVNKRIIFYVRDTGIGIPFVKLEKIFERFTKVADVKTKHYRGTGLGLSIALRFANLLDGDIRVESEENKGSIFYVSLPYIEENLSVTTNTQEIADNTTSLLKGKTILVVEDVEWNSTYLKILLNMLEAKKVLLAKDGAEAVSICKQHSEIDLVLMDIQMPEMNGYIATQRIREFNPDLPIIAQTAYVMPDEKDKCFEVGCNGFISKPIRKDELIRVILEVLHE